MFKNNFTACKNYFYDDDIFFSNLVDSIAVSVFAVILVKFDEYWDMQKIQNIMFCHENVHVWCADMTKKWYFTVPMVVWEISFSISIVV